MTILTVKNVPVILKPDTILFCILELK
jgi:hypothetical protein